MKRIFENILTFIIMTFIILIIALVVYIGLDIGGIIEVPDRYSVVKLLNIDGKIIEVTNTINQEREKKESEKVSSKEKGNKNRGESSISQSLPRTNSKNIEYGYNFKFYFLVV